MVSNNIKKPLGQISITTNIAFLEKAVARRSRFFNSSSETPNQIICSFKGINYKTVYQNQAIIISKQGGGEGGEGYLTHFLLWNFTAFIDL